MYRRLNLSMTHQSSEPLDGDGDASADNMGACASCVDPDPRANVFPNFKTLTQDQVSLIIGKAAMKSCPLDPAPTCDSTGSWCTVTGNHLYDQHVVWIWSVRRGMEAGPRITQVLEVWSRHRVQTLLPSKQPSVCLQVIWKSSCSSTDWSYDDQRSAPWAPRSAYRKHHSTESALLKVKNDILLNMDA